MSFDNGVVVLLIGHLHFIICEGRFVFIIYSFPLFFNDNSVVFLLHKLFLSAFVFLFGVCFEGGLWLDLVD